MKRTFLIICLSLSCLSACSRLDFAFNWADTYIASEVDDYFDISSQQSKSLKKSLKHDLDKIKSAFPEWITEARHVQKTISSGTLDKNEINTIFSFVIKNVSHITTLFSETAVEFIATIDPKQLDYFTRIFHKKAEEDREKLLGKKNLEDLLKKYYKYFEMFLGSLTTDQKNLIENHVHVTPFPSQLKLKNKEWVFQQFIKQRVSLDSQKNFVRSYLNQPEKFELPEYRQALQQYYQSLQNLLADVLLTLTPKQKEELRQNIQEKLVQLQKIQNQG